MLSLQQQLDKLDQDRLEFNKQLLEQLAFHAKSNWKIKTIMDKSKWNFDAVPPHQKDLLIKYCDEFSNKSILERDRKINEILK